VLVFLVVEDRENPVMVQRLDDLELTSRRSFQMIAVLLRRCLRNRVLPDSTEDVVEGGVLGQPILLPRSIGDQVAEDVIAHPA
jgi:hypothetical protein